MIALEILSKLTICIFFFYKYAYYRIRHPVVAMSGPYLRHFVR